MPRLKTLDDVLFPVEEHPVFVSFTTRGVERRLPVPDKKAIVNRNTQRVLGIVSRDYRLVTNEEALGFAEQCCRTVFPETERGEWTEAAVDAPSTAGYCHIDLVHKTAALDFDDVRAGKRPEAFGPFIRVTNSYNGLRALGFEIGFYRKVCRNGLIAPDTIVRFRYSHSRRDIGKTIEFDIAAERLAKFKKAFLNSLRSLRSCGVQRSQFEPLIMGVLQLREPLPNKSGPRLMEDWGKLRAHLDELSSRYAEEMGESAYAVFNAITDFASAPPENRCVHRDRHSFQKLAGWWLTSFNDESRKPDFTISAHLERLAKKRSASSDLRF
jgi:hypothetical protein